MLAFGFGFAYLAAIKQVTHGAFRPNSSKYDYNVILELWPPEQDSLDKTIELEQAWALESVPYLRRYIKD
jgi:hypothetical protein